MAKRKQKKYAAVVGLAGAGEASAKAIRSHLADFIESIDGEILWVLPFTDNVTKSVSKALNFLWDEEVSYVLVDDETIDDKDWVEDAQEVVPAEDAGVYSALVTEVIDRGGDDGDTRLIVIFDEDDKSDVELVEAAIEEGVVVHDLAAGLAKVVFEEDDDDDEVEEAEEVAEEPEEAPVEAEEADVKSPEVDLPDAVVDALEAGKTDEAVKALVDALSNPQVKDLADELGVEREKGQYARTIAKNIIDHLIYAQSEGEAEVEEEFDDEEAPEDTPVEPEEKLDENFVDTSEDEPETGLRFHPEAHGHYPGEIIQVLAQVAMAHNTEEAANFLDLIKSEGLFSTQ